MGLIRTVITEQREDVADMLKLLRADTLTVKEVSSELTISIDTCRRWLDTFVEHGIVERMVDHDVRIKPAGGTVPFVYRLSKQWGGQA